MDIIIYPKGEEITVQRDGSFDILHLLPMEVEVYDLFVIALQSRQPVLVIGGGNFEGSRGICESVSASEDQLQICVGARFYEVVWKKDYRAPFLKPKGGSLSGGCISIRSKGQWGVGSIVLQDPASGLWELADPNKDYSNSDCVVGVVIRTRDNGTVEIKLDSLLNQPYSPNLDYHSYKDAMRKFNNPFFTTKEDPISIKGIDFDFSAMELRLADFYKYAGVLFPNETKTNPPKEDSPKDDSGSSDRKDMA